MAFKKTGITFNETANEWMEHYECDHEWEVANLPKCNPGSTVKVLDTGKEYSVGNNGLWGGGGGVSSWDDIPDRPFGEETKYEIIDEITTEAGSTITQGNFGAFEEGKTYIVTYDGVDYECVAEKSGDEVFIGNPIFLPDGVGDNGMPFAAWYVDAASYAIFVIDEKTNSVSHTAAIKALNTVITPIPKKYLPEPLQFGEETGMVEVLAECQPIMTDPENPMRVVMGIIPTLVIDENYIVNYNGADYICVCQDMSAMQPGAVMLGNGADFGGLGNGEPFVVVATEDENGKSMMVLPLDGSASVTISIHQNGTIIHTIDPKYLPGSAKSVLVVQSFNNMGNTITSHTAQNISAANKAGMAVFLYNQGRMLPLNEMDEGAMEAHFCCVYFSDNMLCFHNATVTADGTVTNVAAGVVS